MTRDAILVLGMHRSGTSATSGALGRLGIPLGSNLVEPAEDNPLGYFEHGPVVAAHEAFLETLGRTWADPSPLPAEAFVTPAAEACRGILRQALQADFSGLSRWAIKDPRLSRLLPLWEPLWGALAATPRALIVLRHPSEVAASLARRDGFPAELAHWLWLRHTLDAWAATREWPRALLAYDALIATPDEALAAALARIGVVLPRCEPGTLAGFIDAGMNHHRGLRPPASGVAARLAEAVFDHLLATVEMPDVSGMAALQVECEAAWAEVAPAISAGLATVPGLVAGRVELRAELLKTRSALSAQLRWSEAAVADLTALREQQEAGRHAAAEQERVEAVLRRDLAFAERLVRERESERDALSSERDALSSERDALSSERDALSSERDALSSERDALRHDLDLILASRSWRWTAPLRRFAGLLARIFQ